MPRLRRPKEITYPENPWQGIARVTVRRRDYRFDGKYGSPESIEQHAEWVRIYDETGIPPEIETVRASLLVQREGIPMPTEFTEPPAKVAKSDYRFSLAMATAIGCTLVLSGSLLIRSSEQPTTVPPESPSQTTFAHGDQDTSRADQAFKSIPIEQPFPRPRIEDPFSPALATRLNNLTSQQRAKFDEIAQSQGHPAAFTWLSELPDP